MKQTILIFAITIASLSFSSCNGWLKEDGPMTGKVEYFFINSGAAVQSVNAVYAPLMWEYNGTYFSEFFIGDIASDDALKGGQNISDMADAYDIDNFKTIADNGLLLQYYRAQYQGIARANLAIEQVGAMTSEDIGDELKSRLLGEAHFLRAAYYFRLVRLFGDVPLVTAPIYSSAEWRQPRSSEEKVYARIISDLETAEKSLINKSEYAGSDLGRATKGAAQALLLKTNLYFGNWYERNGDNGKADEYYAAAMKWGGKFMLEQASEYSLCTDYSDNFTEEGENGPESVFEIQYMSEPTSDYGEGNGFTRGTFTTILTRSRSAVFENAGWGFNHPTKNLYDEFETGDPRREASILTPTDEEITNPVDEIYLGSRYLTVKRTMLGADRKYIALNHDTRSQINNVRIRLADVYLLYAEAALNTDDLVTAKQYLEKVRARARGTQAILPEFPGYNGYTDTEADLEKAIRHERRVELAMEGHRWFDICRWGMAKQVMDNYRNTESPEARAEMAPFVEGKHELMPIPQEEIQLGGLTQNNGYM